MSSDIWSSVSKQETQGFLFIFSFGVLMNYFPQYSMSLYKRILSIVLIVALLPVVAGCATLFKGRNEKVAFNSNPVGADVYVNGVKMGTTPIELKLDARNSYTIEFRKEGFQSVTRQIQSGTAAGYVILDILGGLVPVIIDAATGAWSTLDTDNVNAALEKQK